MEGPLEHLLHGAVLSAVLYFVMKFLLKQSENVAVTRSLFIGLVATLYMLMFGLFVFQQNLLFVPWDLLVYC